MYILRSLGQEKEIILLVEQANLKILFQILGFNISFADYQDVSQGALILKFFQITTVGENDIFIY